MFQHILEITKENINTVRSILKINEQFRKLIFSKEIDQDKLIKKLKIDAPEAKSWLVFDHCASVTRLYAIYEQFVEDLIRDWLAIVPTIFPEYSELPDKITMTHQKGVGQLLSNLDKERYEHLSSETVIRGLFSGVTNQKEYQILSDAFLIHEQNLWQKNLIKILADAGIDNSWDWMKKHRSIKRFVKDTQTTPDAKLKELISYRNDAAHGGRGIIDNSLGLKQLLELCDFVEALCHALAELVSYQVIKNKEVIKKASKIGEITEWFPIPKAAIVTSEIQNINLSVGQKVFLVSNDYSYCESANIVSLQINNNSVEQIEIIIGMEVGLKFNVDAREKLYLYIIE